MLFQTFTYRQVVHWKKTSIWTHSFEVLTPNVFSKVTGGGSRSNTFDFWHFSSCGSRSRGRHCGRDADKETRKKSISLDLETLTILTWIGKMCVLKKVCNKAGFLLLSYSLPTWLWVISHPSFRRKHHPRHSLSSWIQNHIYRNFVICHHNSVMLITTLIKMGITQKGTVLLWNHFKWLMSAHYHGLNVVIEWRASVNRLLL